MIKNEKGVTLVALIITIIVMIILASITIAASSNLNKESQVKSLKTSMLLIQAKVEEIYNKKEYGDITELPGEPVSEANISEDEKAEILKELGEDSDNTRHLKKDGTYPEGLKVDSDDFYVNYKTGEVYSKKGFNDGNKTIHLLSELKNY